MKCPTCTKDFDIFAAKQQRVGKKRQAICPHCKEPINI